jgi:hypothetical protein
MGDSARIQSVDVLREVKAALQDFTKEATLAITSVDSDVSRTGMWLTLERPAYWKHEVRRREEAVEAAKAEIRRKEFAAHPNPADTVMERKALKRAKDRLETAVAKQDKVRKWAPAWERESMSFKGGCGPLNEILHRDIPQAIARLDKMMASLEEYFRMAAPATAPNAMQGGAENAESMARGGEEGTKKEEMHNSDLRRFVPMPEERVTEPTMQLPVLEWNAGMPSEAEGTTVSKLDVAGEMPGMDQTIAVSWRAARMDSVFFVRLDPVIGGGSKDTGWYIGPIEQPETIGGTRVCTVREVLERVPGLRPVLACKVGTLVVLKRGVIRSVQDGGDREMWVTGI